MEPAQSTRCFSPHQAKRGLGLETRVGEDEKTSTAQTYLGCPGGSYPKATFVPRYAGASLPARALYTVHSTFWSRVTKR
jgi:hypothetical protein